MDLPPCLLAAKGKQMNLTPLCAQGQKLGKLLLLDALKRCSHSSAEVALFAVEVVAIDDKARDFYLKYGFTPLADNPNHLYLAVKAIQQLGL